MAARRPSASSLASRQGDTVTESRRDSNIFSDDYAESINGEYADSEDARSIRRADSVRSLGIHSHPEASEDPFRDNHAPTVRSAIQSSWHAQHTQAQSSRSSTRKSNRGLGAGDAENGAVLALNTHGIPPARLASHRSTSSGSSASFAQPLSPTSVTQGPSHPYGMYPQGLAMSRSGSVASLSTARTRSQNHGSRRGPAHPYALYAQNVSEDTPIVQSTIPVGFPGQHSNQFRRQIGPEGEEQDIVGPDGHLEQLPPYSRYPEEEHTKFASGRLSSDRQPEDGATSLLPETQPAAETHEAEEDSTEATPLHGQPGDASGFGFGPSEKTWDEKSWKERRNTRIACMPLWGFIALMSSLVVGGVILGAVVGVAVGKHSSTDTASASATKTGSPYGQYGHAPPSVWPVATLTVTTTMMDATPIASVPTSVPLPPVGNWSLLFGEATMTNAACMLESWQSSAWSCRLTPSSVQLSLTACGPPGSYNASLSFPGNRQFFTYGEQTPNIPPQVLKPAMDITPLQDFGMAYQFQTTYSKLVIVDEEALVPSPASKKRWYSSPGQWRELARTVVDPNDTPWFCEFDNTFIEGFVYVQNDTAAVAAAAAAASSSLATITSQPTPPTPVPSSTTPSGSMISSAHSYERNRKLFAGFPAVNEPPIVGTYSIAPRQAVTAPPAFPKKFKLLERRLNNYDGGIPAVCTKKSYNNQTYSWQSVLDANQNPVKMYLTESDPTLSKRLGKRDFSSSECYCQWMSS